MEYCIRKKRQLFPLILVGVLLITGFFIKSTACNDPEDLGHLVLNFRSTYTASIGWGDIYKCKVLEVQQGKLEDTIFSLYIIVNNYDSLFFQFKPNGERMDYPKESYLVGRFKEVPNDKPYVNFKNAFIDQKKRTWELVELNRTSTP